MSKDVIIRGVTYQGVDKLSLPVSGGAALFRDTSDGDAVAGEIVSGKKAYNANGAVNGSMVNQGAVSGTISDKDTPYTIPAGYHNGSGTVEIASAQKALLLPGNIRDGVTILGVTGTYSGGGCGGATNLIPASATWDSGYLNTGGGVDTASSTNKEKYTVEYIPVDSLVGHWLLIVSRVQHSGQWQGVVFYRADYSYITRVGGSSVTVGTDYYMYNLYLVPSSAAYFRFSLRTYGVTCAAAVYDIGAEMDLTGIVPGGVA